MQKQLEREDFKTAFCDKYEELLLVSKQALETWANRREEAWQMGLRGKELGGELVRLQADFAKSYAQLQRHTRECPLCQFVAKIGKDNSGYSYMSSTHESRPA
jgi:hypothetical protein